MVDLIEPIYMYIIYIIYLLILCINVMLSINKVVEM